MKYLFWNTHNNEEINQYLCLLIEEYNPDFVGLAEFTSNGKDLEKLLIKKGLDYKFIPKIGSRVDILIKGKRKGIKHYRDCEFYAIKTIPGEKEKQIVVLVHFPCKQHADDHDYEEIIHLMLDDLEYVKRRVCTKNVVILGDFNLNPFDAPMINATSLQAISSKEIVIRREYRKYKKKQREFYYNPMWNFLGDRMLPPGSYYYTTPHNKALFWNTIDQFVVSKELANDVNLEKIKYITNVGGIELCNKYGHPSISDHFPLYFEIGEKE